MRLLKELMKISKESNIELGEVYSKYDFLSRRLYKREYEKFKESLNKNSVDILKRYYQRFKK